MPGLDATAVNQVIGMVQGQALKIIGGVPILKNVLGSTLEKLKLPKHLDIGNVEQILAAVQAGGIGALLQAPLAAAQGALNAAIGSAQSALTAALGGAAGALNSALGNLSASAGALGALASNLSGFTNTQGLANQFDLIGHMALAQAFGSALPSSLSLATVTAPITSSALIGTIQISAQSIANQVIAGTMTVSAGISAVAALQNQIDGIASASTSAISTLASAAPALSAASSAVALLASGPSEMQAAMAAAIRPDILAAVQGIVSDHLADVSGS